jgi:hypothetical protein
MEAVVRSKESFQSSRGAGGNTEQRGMDKDRYNDETHPGRCNVTAAGVVHEISVALLTGGADKPYVFGLAPALISKGDNTRPGW